jgi:hypothetical protein
MTPLKKKCRMPLRLFVLKIFTVSCFVQGGLVGEVLNNAL